MKGTVYWRCFHCGAGFTKAQAKHAAEHFGASEYETPVCKMRVPGEGHLLTVLRKAQAELRASQLRAFESKEAEDLMNALHAQAADYEQRLIRAEEEGYARGWQDGREVKQLPEESK